MANIAIGWIQDILLSSQFHLREVCIIFLFIILKLNKEEIAFLSCIELNMENNNLKKYLKVT